MSRWVESLHGLEVKVTGDFRRTALGMTQPEIEALLADHGARVVGDVRRTTDLLIRADSPAWKYGRFGAREVELAENLAAGRAVGVLEVDALVALLDGEPVWARDPASVPPALPPAGITYRRAAPSPAVDGLLLVERDPAELARALAGHADTQNALADFVSSFGFEPLSPVGNAAAFDLAWDTGAELWLAEVKSLSAENETLQLRLGLGQVLEYADLQRRRLGRPVRPVLAVQAKPSADHWTDVCASAGVTLTWAPEFESLVVALSRPSFPVLPPGGTGEGISPLPAGEPR